MKALESAVGHEPAFSPKELMATFISRQLNDGDYVTAGAGLFLPRAGVMLAHFTRCPNLKLALADYFVNLLGAAVIEEFEFYADHRVAKYAEGFLPLEIRYDVSRRLDLFFVGGLQVDRFGNTNLIGIGNDHDRLKLRGAGSIGTTTVAAMVKRYFIFTTDHSARVFVEKVDFVSAVGWARGGADARKKLGLPGGGPELVITPKCVMDFEPKSKSLRLKALTPGVTVEEVVASTGFDLIVPDTLEELEPPTATELAVLRTRIDPKGVLRH
ncbi:MAG: hypothetical protein HY329_21770 [Chloroflexi bacterium]|nr:hypothetical protein [Chloroflexota bacterium]